MNAPITYVFTQLLVLLLSCSLVFAQDAIPPQQESQQEMQQATPQQDAPVPQQYVPRQSRPAFTQQELDQMLAPIALYPDSLLSQILMASTYPLEVVEAARWSKANPNLKGDQAVQGVAQNTWDPSVKSLVAFPQILLMMDEKLNWMERLGDAFLAQQQRGDGHNPESASKGVCRRQSHLERPDPRGATGTVHRGRTSESTSSLCPLLRSDGDVWAVVVAGVSTSLLGSLARLFHRSEIRGGFRVGHRDRGWSRILLRRIQLALPPCQHCQREQLLLSPSERHSGNCMGTRSRPPPGCAVPGCGIAPTVWSHERVA